VEEDILAKKNEEDINKTVSVYNCKISDFIRTQIPVQIGNEGQNDERSLELLQFCEEVFMFHRHEFLSIDAFAYEMV